MSIWIPRTTSGFDSENDSLKIGGVCYRAIQKNVTKSQAESAETYNSSTHGAIGEKFEDCEACDNAQATWGIVGFHLTSFGVTDYPAAAINDDADTSKHSKFFDDIISKKSDIQLIVENPTVDSFVAAFDLASPDSANNDWKTWQQDPGIYNYGGASSWELFVMLPTSLGIDSFTQSGNPINTSGDITYQYRGVMYDIKVLGSSLAEDNIQEDLAFTKES